MVYEIEPVDGHMIGFAAGTGQANKRVPLRFMSFITPINDPKFYDMLSARIT